MINTLYGTDQLVGAGAGKAFFLALVVGLLFGIALERAGFGSSRRLAGIFYFRDMTVLKVMFTGLVTAMLGLSLLVGLGWLDMQTQLNLLPTMYGAQIVGGLLFGVGFVVSGWCPGTAAVGAASGKLDAVVFLGGTVLGSILYNETYPAVSGLRAWGAFDEPLMAFGLSRATFGLLLTIAAVGAFHAAEWVERRMGGGGCYLNTPFLRVLCLAFVVFATAMFLFPHVTAEGPATAGDGSRGGAAGTGSATALLEAIQAEEDHFEPEELADRLLQGDPSLIVIDVRSAAEYAKFHIRGARNVLLSGLLEALAPHKNAGTIVLYSNGMTHPAQARDILAQAGFRNVYHLTGGLDGFIQWCLKPVSLRAEPLTAEKAERVRTWRAYFLAEDAPLARVSDPSSGASNPTPGAGPEPLPPLVETDWLEKNLSRPDVKIIDVRAQPAYNTSHIPGAVCLHPESFRGVVGGVPSMLLPADLLAGHVSLMGIEPTHTVVIVPGDALRDATLVGMGFERLRHARWGLLKGGFAEWSSEMRPVTNKLTVVQPTRYPVPSGPAGFTVDRQAVLARVRDGKTVILDTRPADFYTGVKSDEARAGHIPGAVNRPFSDDVVPDGPFKLTAELSQAYTVLIPDKQTPVIVHCRTGHQASQTYFLLTRLLGYSNVSWYDGSWTDWAAHEELPIEKP